MIDRLDDALLVKLSGSGFKPKSWTLSDHRPSSNHLELLWKLEAGLYLGLLQQGGLYSAPFSL